jgi:hypothetical protein
MLELFKIFAAVDDIDKMKVWKLESFIPSDQLEKAFIKSINLKRYSIRGDVKYLKYRRFLT